jgi:hypothetical protein
LKCKLIFNQSNTLSQSNLVTGSAGVFGQYRLAGIFLLAFLILFPLGTYFMSYYHNGNSI